MHLMWESLKWYFLTINGFLWELFSLLSFFKSHNEGVGNIHVYTVMLLLVSNTLLRFNNNYRHFQQFFRNFVATKFFGDESLEMYYEVADDNASHKFIILVELMYIVFVPFDWTRALSRVCFWFVHNFMNFYVFDSFITWWTFLHNQYKQYGGHRQETTIVFDWKQAWKSV